METGRVLALPRRRTRVRPAGQPLDRRVVTAQMNAAWNVGRARYLVALCQQSVREHHCPV